MPHGGGGGSHGGGFHGGSHHSGGRSGPSRRCTSTPFLGARRYVIYRDHRPYYYYADYDITKRPSKARYLLLLFYIPFVFAVFCVASTAFVNPKKIVDKCHSASTIYDSIGAIDNKKQVQNKLNEFYNTTGIPVTVLTIDNSVWKHNYSSLESFAYDEYVSTFRDENHMLLVYSVTVKDNGFKDWHFEFMNGDDTSNILSESREYTISKTIDKALRKDASLGDAIITGYDAILPGIMDSYFDAGSMVGALFMAGFICFHCYFMVFYDPSKKYRGAVAADTKFSEVKCSYCQGIYVAGTVTSCPHCGAPIEATGNVSSAGYSSAGYNQGYQNNSAEDVDFNAYGYGNNQNNYTTNGYK